MTAWSFDIIKTNNNEGGSKATKQSHEILFTVVDQSNIQHTWNINNT